MPSSVPVSMAAGKVSNLFSEISLRTVGVLIMISTAAITPPCLAGTSRWHSTAARLPASVMRTWSRSLLGKKSRIRCTDCAAVLTCRVESTKWPVSAALSATERLMESRIFADHDDVRVLPQNVLER